ncbi:MAG: hypothetical protein AMK72_06165 [Planctomycetes bacterium SM23_25]|nr:MAG: hypothetical protein AMK72_06165 [Planctomycetes bacterium SM23_25]
MRIQRTADESDAIINISSLVDVMFILLIFFLATTTFKQEELDLQVNLPQSAANRSLSAATQLIVINIRAADRPAAEPLYVVSNRQMTIEQLRATVAEAVRGNPDQKILVRGDRHAFHGDVAAAVTACSEAGIKDVNIGYDKKPTG